MSLRRVISALPLLLCLAVTAQAQSCTSSSQCPQSAPCCSDFGYCGSGTFCLGGCNPFASYSVQSCMPEPVCQSSNYTFSDLSRIQTNSSAYDGDASKYDWVLDGGNVASTNGSVAMILTETNGGTRLSSTRYVHYGNMTARIKTGRWAGVVTAFITMSDIKDEIDWEWPGNETTKGQTNYFWQGIVPTTTHGNITSGISDTYDNWHDYGINWTPTTLSWLVDGKVVRTLKASDTLVDGVSQFPNTPSRIELSLWPAGINSSAPGTIEWAGGMIDWSNSDYTANGNKFEAYVSSVSVQCADPTSPSGNTTSYVYSTTNSSTNTPSVAFSSNTTVLTTTQLSSSGSKNSSANGGSSTGSSSTGSSSNSSSSSGLSGRQIGIIAGSIVGGIAGLIFIALIVRTCVFAFTKRGQNAGGAAAAFGGGQKYRPLHDPAPEAHAMSQVP